MRPYADFTVEAKEIYRAIGSLYEGQGIRKVGRVYEVDKDEVLGWLMAASVAFLMPMLITFFAGQRYFLRGISTSGLAGR